MNAISSNEYHVVEALSEAVLEGRLTGAAEARVAGQPVDQDPVGARERQRSTADRIGTSLVHNDDHDFCEPIPDRRRNSIERLAQQVRVRAVEQEQTDRRSTGTERLAARGQLFDASWFALVGCRLVQINRPAHPTVQHREIWPASVDISELAVVLLPLRTHTTRRA